jgi:N-acetylmuramoyl-L-alanine amidase
MPYCDSSIKAIVPAAVVIDPGHWKRIKTAGYDPGAVNGAIHEAERVWVISNRTKTTLDASAGGKPLTVRLTHDGTNGQMTLRQRAAVARPLLADVYLSVHLNAAGTNTVRGVETFYDSTGNTNTAQDTALGTLINNAVVALTGQNNRGVKGKGLGTLDDVAMGNTNACSITRSCLVEVGFLSNNTFAAWINTAANANSVGDTLATAILSCERRLGGSLSRSIRFTHTYSRSRSVLPVLGASFLFDCQSDQRHRFRLDVVWYRPTHRRSVPGR